MSFQFWKGVFRGAGGGLGSLGAASAGGRAPPALDDKSVFPPGGSCGGGFTSFWGAAIGGVGVGGFGPATSFLPGFYTWPRGVVFGDGPGVFATFFTLPLPGTGAPVVTQFSFSKLQCGQKGDAQAPSF